MHARAIHGRRLAMVIVLTDDGGVDESCFVIGRADWDGRQVGLVTAEGQRFLVPGGDLETIAAVPPEAAAELDGAELYVVLERSPRPRRDTRELRPAC